MAEHNVVVDPDLNGNKITNLGAPAVGGDATTKTYVDAAVAGAGSVAGAGLTESPAGTLNVANTDGRLTIGANSVDFSATASGVVTSGTHFFDSGFYNVTDHGISTANSAATNLTAMNTLLTLATGNATIYFPPSTTSYQFSGVVTIPAKSFKFVGGGQAKTIIATTHATNDIFAVGANNTDFCGLHFSSTVTRTGGAAVASGSFEGVNVYDCSFAGMFNAVVYSGTGLAGFHSLVQNCYFTTTVNNAIKIDAGSAYVRIADCQGFSSPAGNTVALIEINQCGSVVMDNCQWFGGVNSMRLNPDSGTKIVQQVACSNVVFEGATGSAVKTFGGAAGTVIKIVKFVNCVFSGNTNGFEFASVTSTVVPTDFRFANCDFIGNSNTGLLATVVGEFSVSNCLMAGNTNQGIDVSASSGSVTKFEISNCTIGAGAGLGANSIGIFVNTGTYGGYVISNNVVIGNTVPINDSGSVATTDRKKIINNAGHLIQGAIVTNRGAATSGTGETLLFNARIPGGPSVLPGQTFRFGVWGQGSSTGIVVFRIRAGAAGTVAGDTTVIAEMTSPGGEAANSWLVFEGLMSVVATGGSGSVGAAGWLLTNPNIFLSIPTGAETLATVNMNNAWFIDISASCSVGTFTVRRAVIELL